MRRLAVIAFLMLGAFIAQFILYNSFGSWLNPNLLLLVVIFFNLYLGIRFSIFCALLAGLMLDGVSTGPFGINLFCYIASAYAGVFVKRYLYQIGSNSSRVLIAFLVTIFFLTLQFLSNAILQSWAWQDVLKYVILPQLFFTTAITVYVFNFLKILVKKFGL